MTRNRLALVVTVAMVLTAGCVDATMTTEVGADGEIESMTVEVELEAMAYGFLEQAAVDEGYESVEAWLQAETGTADDDEIEFEDVTVEQTDEGTYLITMSAGGFAATEQGDVDVTVSEDTVRFEDGLVGDALGESDDEFDDEFGMVGLEDGDFTLTYVLVMPGEITDTNADSVSDDGTTATWTFDLTQETDAAVYAESGIDESGFGDDDGLSGFGPGVTVLTLLLSAVGLRVRR